MELTDIVTKIKDAHPNIGFIKMFGMEDTYTFLIHFRYDDEEHIEEEEEEDEYEEDEEYNSHKIDRNYRHMFIHNLCITSENIEEQVEQLVEKCKKICIKSTNDTTENPWF